MTDVYMEGFETVIDNIDMTARGWHMGSVLNFSGQNVMTLPSRTGTPGRGLMLRGPYTAISPTWLPLSSNIDFGMVDTGQTVNALWNAGGFAVGFNATFNSGVQTQVACEMSGQVVYDGSQYYWAILLVGATLTIGYSTDLQHWTTVPAMPPGGNISQVSSIMVMGSGINATVMIGRFVDSSLWPAFYYTTNAGLSWTATTMPAAGIASYMMRGCFTGNVATPFIGFGVSNTNFQTNLVYYTSLTATPVSIGINLATTVSNAQIGSGFAKVVNGVACFSAISQGGTAVLAPMAVSSSVWFCPVSADMTVAANYKQSPVLASKQIVDITFFNNTWIAVGFGGIFTAANGGTPSAPAAPTAAWSQVVTALGTGVLAVDTNGSICVAVGFDTVTASIGAIYTSVDGVTWVKQNRFFFNSAANLANGNAFTNVIWDGKQFVIFGGVNNNVIATSPDGFAWTGVYYPDYTEAAGATSGSFLGVYSGILNPGTYVAGAQGQAGTYSPWNGSSTFTAGFGFSSGPVSGLSRTVSAMSAPSGSGSVTVTTQTSQPVAVATLNHYYEIIAKSVPGTMNQFTFQFAIDGVVLPFTSAATFFANSTDNTGLAHLLINLPRSGNWTVIDDIYVTTMNGTYNVGQLGIVNVLPIIPSGDVGTDGFTKSGSLATNAASVAGPYSNSENFVSATTVPAKDVYSTTSQVPAGYRVRAVQIEGLLAKFGSSGATGNVGVVNGGTEVDSPTVSAMSATPSFASVLTEIDPATGV